MDGLVQEMPVHGSFDPWPTITHFRCPKTASIGVEPVHAYDSEDEKEAPWKPGQDDPIPSHPLGVLPLGNQYLSAQPNARASIGSLRGVPDEVLLAILEHIDGSALLALGASCRFLYAFCRLDELWKAIFLGTSAPEKRPVVWRGTWRCTVLGLEKKNQASPDCGSVFSDVLHRPFACSQVDPARYASTIPERNRMTRLPDLSHAEFSESWAERPFVLTDAARSWPACREWSIGRLRARFGEVEFRAEAVDWPLAAYCDYMDDNCDESPLYLFDRGFSEKMGVTVGRGPGDAYWKPDCFGSDLFEVLGDERPAHRWLIVGPRGSGSTFHKDPNATSAWNAVVRGAKYWIMFPPRAAVPGVYVSADAGEVTSPLSIAEWLLAFHAEARRLPDCVEGTCGPGEILHVPSGWWHLVVNLEPGIALTQNFVPESPSLHHLAEVLAFLRDRPEQVTGFAARVADPFGLFVERLRARYPELLDRALGVLEGRDKKQKRKWDEAIGDGEADGQESAGFSFGFGGDEDEVE